MDSNSPGNPRRNPRRFFLRRSTSCGNYERFKKSDSQDEMQKGVFSISSPRKGIRRLSTKDSTTAMAKAKSRKVLLISNPRMPHQRCSLSDSTTAMAKAKVLNNGVPLMKKSEKTSCFDIFRNPRYAFEIRLLDKVIHDFIQYQISSQLSLKSKNLIPELERLCHMCELGVMDERMVNGTIVPKLTTDLHESDMMLQQICPDGMFSGAFDKTPTCNYSGLVKPDFVVGLEKYFNLKTILLQRGLPVSGMQGMARVGKTAMSMAVCNGALVQEIKVPGARQNNILFIRVSVSPNIRPKKVSLETVPERFEPKKAPSKVFFERFKVNNGKGKNQNRGFNVEPRKAPPGDFPSVI